jgi:hypothetical protein
MSYINEIKNQVDRVPAVLHTDRGGEFGSIIFKNFLSERGIVLEQGPANSPQTNGLAERFNRTLLMKIRCMLAQCSVPLNYWDEAAKFASTLINMRPSISINWKSPMSMLVDSDAKIEQVRHVQTLIPFGMKVFVHNQKPISKIVPPSKPLLFLGYEPCSDAMRFLDPVSRRIVISRDYTPSVLNFRYNSSNAMMKLASTLPNSNGEIPDKERFVTVHVPEDKSSNNHQSAISPFVTPPFSPVSQTAPSLPPIPPSPAIDISIPPPHPLPPTKHYTYVWGSANQKATRDISSKIDPSNIIEGSRRMNPGLPDLNVVLEDEFPQLNLNQSVTINEAMNDRQHENDWCDAMSAEFNSLQVKNTGILTPPPADDKIIGGMWLMTQKLNEFNEISRHKARWVVFGNHQEHMLHYFETYSSVAQNKSLKMMLSLPVNENLHVFQFDVETAFLYGKIDASIYVSQVLGFEDPDPKKKGWVWKLKKSLYGTKQAPRMWKEHLVSTLNSVGFTASILDDALFHNWDYSILLHMHVDDGLIVGKSRPAILQFLKNLQKTYVLKIKERPSQHLGYTLVWNSDHSLLIHQSDFTSKILDEFSMNKSNPVKAPSPLNFHRIIASESPPFDAKVMQKAIGMLNYLALHTRPDIAFTVNVLAQFTNAPTQAHWSMVKHLLWYLGGSADVGMLYTKGGELDGLSGWVDADYGTSLVTKNSMSGYVITFFGNPISWTTKKQSVVAQSTTEAEFISINKCAKQLRWMSNLITSLKIGIGVPTIFNDNSGAVRISKEPQLNPNTKHIKIRFQYIRQLMITKVLNIKQASTVDMIADILTKPFGKIKLAVAFKQLHLTNVRV